MKFHLPHYQSPLRKWLHIICCVLLCVGLVAPKVTLALSGVTGDGFRSVVICTGTGLVRVTVSADGKIVSDISESWASPHCVPVTDDTESLVRKWQRFSYPQIASSAYSVTSAVFHNSSVRFTQLSNRGPPVIC